jgi:agmatine deiminase
VLVAYMNSYAGDGFVIAPLAGAAADEEALVRIAAAYPGHEVVGVPAVTVAYGGGGPHCITQHVPATAA